MPDSRLPLRRSGGPAAPKDCREHCLNRRVAAIAFAAKLPSPTQRSAGDTVQGLVRWLTFRKTHERITPDAQPVGLHPRVVTTHRPTARRPPRTSGPAQRDTTGHPKASTDPKARRARLNPRTGVPRHPGARSATPIAPTTDERSRDEGPGAGPKPLAGTS